jgi:hypothetical protein
MPNRVELAGSTGAAISTTNPMSVAYPTFSAAASFTPANTSHTAGDSVGVAAEFALAAPSASLLRIVSASLLVAGGTNETATWRLYLFSVTPPSALADDAAFLLASGDRASFLGYFDFAQLVDVGDTLYIEATPNKVIRLTGTSVFAYLVNLATVTTAAIARTVTIHTSLAPS